MEMKQAVAQQLQDVVRSFIASESSGLAHGETPFLIAVTQALADACAASPDSPETLPQLNALLSSRNLINDASLASAVTCMAPSLEGGPPTMRVALRDPIVF